MIFSAQGLSTAPVNQVLDAGNYAVTLISATGVTSKEKGTPGIKLDLSISAGPVQEASGADPTGKHIFWTLWIPLDGAGRAMGLSRLAKLCKVCGVSQEDDLDLDQFVGKEFIVRLKLRDYNGEPQEDIADFKAIAQ